MLYEDRDEEMDNLIHCSDKVFLSDFETYKEEYNSQWCCQFETTNKNIILCDVANLKPTNRNIILCYVANLEPTNKSTILCDFQFETYKQEYNSLWCCQFLVNFQCKLKNIAD